jgi:hypothetical protein
MDSRFELLERMAEVPAEQADFSAYLQAFL